MCPFQQASFDERRTENVKSSLGLAFICFFAADWELGNADEWSVSVYVSQSLFDQLWDSAHQLQKVEINALLGEDIYTNFKHVPFNFPHVWRLCPEGTPAKLDRLTPAWAKVDWISVQELKHALPGETDDDLNEKDDATPKRKQNANHSAKSFQDQVVGHLRTLSQRLVWIAIAIVAAAIIIRSR